MPPLPPLLYRPWCYVTEFSSFPNMFFLAKLITLRVLSKITQTIKGVSIVSKIFAPIRLMNFSYLLCLLGVSKCEKEVKILLT